MKKKVFAFLTMAALLPIVPTASQAQWYGGADLGTAYLQDSDTKGSGTTFDTEFDWGVPVALGRIGYALKYLSVEGEVGYRKNDVDKVNGASSSGDVSAASLMTNAVYDLLPEGRFHPFIGAGLGAAHVDASVKQYSGKQWRFAYQGFVGMGYDLTDRLRLNGQYRYFATADHNVEGVGSSPSLKGQYASHSLLAGLTYYFGASKKTAAPVPPAIVAEAPKVEQAPETYEPLPPRPIVRNFMVFFDWDQAAITPEATAILNEVVAEVRRGNIARIDLTGYADRSGPRAYNKKLSERRAKAVMRYLQHRGLAAYDFVISAKGESHPLVKTADGVSEPRNRRVEIILP